jgi:hypothetical protein
MTPSDGPTLVGIPSWVKAVTQISAVTALILLCGFMVWDDRRGGRDTRGELISASIQEAAATRELIEAMKTHFGDTDAIVNHFAAFAQQQRCMVKLAVEQDIDAFKIARCFDPDAQIPERRRRR